MKQILGILGAVIVIAVVAILTLGLGKGIGNGTGGSEITKESQNQKELQEEYVTISTEKMSDTETDVLPNTITVTIKENQVFVEDKQIFDAIELTQYIEDINNDQREFKFRDENSILDTYEWVTKVFDDLKIQLIPVKD